MTCRSSSPRLPLSTSQNPSKHFFSFFCLCFQKNCNRKKGREIINLLFFLSWWKSLNKFQTTHFKDNLILNRFPPTGLSIYDLTTTTHNGTIKTENLFSFFRPPFYRLPKKAKCEALSFNTANKKRKKAAKSFPAPHTRMLIRISYETKTKRLFLVKFHGEVCLCLFLHCDNGTNKDVKGLLHSFNRKTFQCVTRRSFPRSFHSLVFGKASRHARQQWQLVGTNQLRVKVEITQPFVWSLPTEEFLQQVLSAVPSCFMESSGKCSPDFFPFLPPSSFSR